MKLENYATVRSGLVLSRKRSDTGEGVNYPLLTLRAIRSQGLIDADELDEYWANERLSNEYVSCIGDIIVRLTAPYTAVLIDENTQGMVISSNFVIIRTDQSILSADYLYWLLNTKKLKYKIYENSTSNMLGAVKSRYFSELPIKLIPLDEQLKIADMNKLAKKEQHLLYKLAQEKEKYYTYIIDKFQKEVRQHD